MLSNPLARAAIARERIRRVTERREQLEVVRRVFAEAAGKFVHATVARRILRLCGLQLTGPEILSLLIESFPSVVWSRDPADNRRRAYVGLRVRPGFSVADIGDYLRRKFNRAVGGESATKKKPAGSLDGVVASFEAVLESEGMPADVNDVKDPVGRSYRELPVTDDDVGDGEQTGHFGADRPGHTKEGWGSKGPLSWWPSQATADDPSIAPDIAAVRFGVAEMAYRIPGFFSKHGAGPAIETMWRLVRLEGMTKPVVGKIVGKTANAVNIANANTEKRLMRHLRALGESNVKRLFDIDNPINTRPSAERYLFANEWKSDLERRIWEKVAIEKASKWDVVRELNEPGLDAREVARIVRKHRARARLPLESL